MKKLALMAIVATSGLSAQTDTGPISSFEEVEMIFNNVGDILSDLRMRVLKLEFEINEAKEELKKSKKELEEKYE